MTNGKNQLKDTDAVFRAMREMWLEASDAEVDALAKEEGLNTRKLSETGRSAVNAAIAAFRKNRAREESATVLHKGLNSGCPRPSPGGRAPAADLFTQASAEADRPKVTEAELCDFRAALAGGAWLTRADLAGRLGGWSDRKIREAAEHLGADIVRCRRGFKLTELITDADLDNVKQAIHHFEHQAQVMALYAQRLRDKVTLKTLSPESFRCSS